MSLKKKSLDQINNAVGETIASFAIKGKYKMIGSNALRSTQYGSDYDIQTILDGATPEKLAKLIQQQFADAEKNPKLWITGFKCGHDPRLVYNGDYSDADLKPYLKNPLIPAKTRRQIMKSTGEKRIELVRDLYVLRWTPEDVKRGEIKLIDGTPRSLATCLLDKATTKIDLIQLVGNQFVDIAEMYFISMGGKSNYTSVPTIQEVQDALEEDIRYYSKMDSFKALKRLFSLLQLEGGHDEQLGKMVEFFNSQVGYLNKIRAEIGILLTILEQKFRKPEWKDVEANIQFIKEQISQIYKIPIESSVFKTLDKITPKTAEKTLMALKDYFAQKVNNHSKEFLKLNI